MCLCWTSTTKINYRKWLTQFPFHLPPNSINSWEEQEHKFHEHFLGEHELELADLASVVQGPEESVKDYIRRFRDTRNLCF
jgi:hypothetical protein